MTSQQLKKLKIPENSGVYIFRDNKKRPIYIGRATSLKDRVKSYFSNNLIETRGPRIVDMITKARFLTWQETDTVLEAIILESTLIKKYQPHYNVDERDDKSSQYVVITDEPWPRVFLERARDFDLAMKDGTLPYKVLKSFGPYTESGLIKEVLKILRRLFPFRDKKAYDPRHERFYHSIGKSPDREDGISAKRKYLRTIEHLILFFEGKKEKIRIGIEKDMGRLAKQMRFEEANQSKRLLFALDHLNDIALIRKDKTISQIGNSVSKNLRIEAYDIAHLSGTNVVGVMTVIVNNELQPSEYRKFKISKEANNDTAALAEIIFRRLNHSEWDYPDIIIVDGNEIQVKVAEDVLKARRISIPVIGVTKDDKHKASRLIGDPRLIESYKKEIVSINSEAHRFAIKYHRQRRGLSVHRGLASR